MKPKKNLKIGRILMAVVAIVAIWKISHTSFILNQDIEIKSGDSAQVIFNTLGWKDKLQVKWYIKQNNIDLSTVQGGIYEFSGSYTPQSLIDTIKEGPKVAYARIVVLEGWSIYDIDQYLADKGLITAGQYIGFVTNPVMISKYQQRYDFLKDIPNINTLEGFLYPDTYKVDKEKDIIDQLVYLQLDAFKKRVWSEFSTLVGSNKLSWYQSLILASIVEKEERNEVNRPNVAGILLKRFQMGTLIGADISLCYNLKQAYKLCTPSVIGQNVKDASNPYNTRAVKGLPPTPIANPNKTSIAAVLQPQETPYFYYLHDSDGTIHYATTLDEHNQNKRFYIQ